jgi:branched-chain amino acid transport system ATP-binding protein
MALLEVRDLHVFYGSIEALKGISLDAEPGQIMAILGGNGAGKTTTLRTISGLLRPRSGTIMFDGRSIVGLEAHLIVGRGLSQVPEGRRIFNVLTVEENLNLGGYIVRSHRELIRTRKAAVYRLFPRLGERRGQLAGTLSGGEQQMLAIGRALMARPRVLLLDEPSMGLAPMIIQQIFRIISEINSQGTTILLVEQNAQQALSRSDRAYVLETGSVIKSGPGRELLADPAIKAAYLGVA